MDWSMGGYGFFVWGSYLCALITIGLEIFFVTRRKRSHAPEQDKDEQIKERDPGDRFRLANSSR